MASLNGISLVILLVMSTGCYVIRQGLRQNELMNQRQLVEAVIAENNADSKQSQKLKFVQEVIAFASREGLDTWQAYQYYVDNAGRPISYLLQVADASRFEMKTWWFPLVGSVPYIGYFDERTRNTQADLYLNQGYDVAKSRVLAFSSLGYFEDPLFASMLKRPLGDLAELIFHELTHRTIWIPGGVRLNENIAEFVGEHLADKFMKKTKRSKERELYRGRLADRVTLRRWVQALKIKLEKHYKNPKLSRTQKLDLKKKTIAEHREKLRPIFKERRYEQVIDQKWNNAKIMGYHLYSADQRELTEIFSCGQYNNIKNFLVELRELLVKTRSLKMIAQKTCQKNTNASSYGR